MSAPIVPTRASSDSTPVAALRVLASGSGGNCSVLLLRQGEKRRLCLIDLGLSPRRTRLMLEAMGLSLDAVDRVFITHFDGDHFRPTWTKSLSPLTRIHLHERHVRLAQKVGIRPTQLEALDETTQEVGGQTRVSCLLAAHDTTGVAAFRFEHAGASIGFATDVGQATRQLVEHVKGVHLLAIESNYCPTMQAASNRPAFLKARIMGGKGHLSNQQCAALTREAHPKSDVVLLHLSQQCNRPQLAAKEHSGAPYRLTIASQDQPTPWIAVRMSGGDEEAQVCESSTQVQSRISMAPTKLIDSA